MEIDQFTQAVTSYFQKSLGYSAITTKIAGNGQSVFLKFPILKKLRVLQTTGTPEDLFLRCDFSQESTGIYNTETNLITAGLYEFFCRSYDLPTLFANKIAATLKRVYFKGKYQKVPSKGRDLYDLFWLLQLSSKTSFALKPNKERLLKLLNLTSIAEVATLLRKKVAMIEETYLYQDLLPLLESKELLKSVKQNLKATILHKLDYVL